MSRQPTSQDISWFIDLQDKGQLNLEPPYQRRSVWSSRDKRFFIDTILNNYPAPSIFLHKSLDDYGRATYHVVDGKQRLKTIIEFTKNQVKIPDDFADVTLQKKRWQELDRSVRQRFWNYVLIVEMLPDVTDAAVRNIFERINRNSRKLTPQEMRHAKWDGWFITGAETESEKKEWREFGLVTVARSKRMADVQFISELLGVVIRRQIQGFDQDALDDLYGEYDDISENETFIEDEFLEEVDRIKTTIQEMFNQNNTFRDYFKVQSHFYSLWCYIALEKHRIPLISVFAQRYAEFMHDVSNVTTNQNATVSDTAEPENQAYFSAVKDYATYKGGASTDMVPRTKRHLAIITAINGLEPVADEDQ